MNRKRRQRWRGIRIEHRGWTVAVIRDQQTGEEVRVYKRLGRWRFYRDDAPVLDQALAATARRVLA